MIYVDEICLGNHENNEENKHDMFQGGAHCSLTTGPTTSKNPSQAKKNLSGPQRRVCGWEIPRSRVPHVGKRAHLHRCPIKKHLHRCPIKKNTYTGANGNRLGLSIVITVYCDNPKRFLLGFSWYQHVCLMLVLSTSRSVSYDNVTTMKIKVIICDHGNVFEDNFCTELRKAGAPWHILILSAGLNIFSCQDILITAGLKFV